MMRRRQRRELVERCSDQLAAFSTLQAQLRVRWDSVREMGDSALTTKTWQGFVDQLADRLLPNLRADFLADPLVRHAMVFTRGGRIRTAELEYLSRQFEQELLVTLLREDAIGDPPLVDIGDVTSANTIHHAYHLARFASATSVDWSSIRTIVEWGGGYGNQAKIARRLIGEQLSHVIIDLPVFSLIQWIYLASVFGADSVALISEAGQPIPARGMTLIPVGLASAVDLRADLMLSTWALSESAHAAQDLVVEREWFGARHLLLAHQRSSDDFPSAGRLGDLAVAAGARSEAVQVLPGSTYAFR
jgi:hypothetical protein